MKRLLISVGLIGLLPFSSLKAEEEKPKARPIPAITAEDKHPKGCVDCHIKDDKTGSDTRLSVAFARWKDGDVEPKLLAKAQAIANEGVTLKAKHPGASNSLQDIPAACIKCHAKMKTAPPFGQLIHMVHLTDGDQNAYLVKYGGECTNCHKPDLTKGLWSHPSAPEK